MTEQDAKNVIRSKIEIKNAPGLLRLAFHDAGTFCRKSKTGGVSGSITCPAEINREENDGLKKSADIIDSLKESLPDLSKADIIALAGAVAVEICGGPVIDIAMGRQDQGEVSPENRLPNENDDADKLTSLFDRMGLSPKELVVLSGAHTLGDAKDKPFTDDRLSFSNDYFQNLLKDLPSHLGRFKSDEALVSKDELKSYVQAYADNKDLFFSDFSKAYQKMVGPGFNNQ